MAKLITLKFPAKCADPRCGVSLAAGASALWYGRGRVYGRGCHEDTRPASERGQGRRGRGYRLPVGATDLEREAYAGAVEAREEARAERAGRGSGPCEDAPCCGCCGPGTGGYGDHQERDEMEGARMGGFGGDRY